MNGFRGLAVLVCLVLTLPSLAFVPPADPAKPSLRLEPAPVSFRGVELDPHEPSPLGDSARAFLARYGGQWTFRIDPRTARAERVQGSGIPLIPGRGNALGAEALDGLSLPDGEITLDGLEPRVRSFLDDNRDLVGLPAGRLVLDRRSSLVREQGRLISFHFRWLVDDLPVEGAHVFVRMNSGNVTQFGAALVGPIALDTTPAVDAAEATRRLLEYSGDAEVARLQGEPELVILPQDGSLGGIEHRLVWKMVYRVPSQIETWEGRVDARTGAVVAFRDLNRYTRVVGGVYPRTVYEDNETQVALPLANIVTESGTVTTDNAGAFPYSGGEISSGLNGQYFDTNCQGCSAPAQPSVLQGVGSGRIDFGLGGQDEIGNGLSTAADRNSFYHLNQVRRIGLKWLPGLGFLANTHFTSNVNIDNLCNAVYTGDAVNFYRSGGGCNNTGEISDVMHHEYGHGVDLNTNGGDGATGEATADVVAMHMTHSPLIGPGFHTDGEPVRDLNQFTSENGLLTVDNIGTKCPIIGTLGPLGYEVHCEGEIYGQTSWDLSLALAAKHGQHTGWRTSERIFYTSLPDAQGYLPSDGSPVYDAYINADDDDGNLINGTPNAQEIFDAFDLHGIAGSLVPTSPACARPAQPALTVTPQCDSFDLSWSSVGGVEHYDVFRSELFEDMGYFPVAELASGVTTFTDTDVAPGMDYWYVVMAVDGAGCESTVESPVAATLPDQPILSVTAAVADDGPQGNHSGFPDPGEDVDLLVTLSNLGQVATGGIAGTITSSTPGVTMLLDSSTWPDLAPGGSGQSQDPLRFRTDDLQLACGETVRFELVPGDDSSCAAETSYFDVLLGEPVAVVTDDFETDLGWQPDLVNSTAATGEWILGDPQQTDYQPGDDVTDGGTQCWYTAANSGGANGTNDVDDGVVILLSTTYDLVGIDGAEVSYYRWFAMSEPGTDPGDFFAADVSEDGGATWVNLETLDFDQPSPGWTRRSFRLEDYITLTDQVMFRFQAADGITDGSIVEAAIDEFRIERLVCDDTPACFDLPTFAGLGAATPGASCGEIELSWAVAVSNCEGGEITYNVYRSTDPGFVPDVANRIAAGLTGTSFTDTLLEPDVTYHYVVRADDARSDEDGNLERRPAVAPASPDTSAPIFAGLETALSGEGCGATLLSWSAGLESCNTPVAYDIYRSTDPGFTPGPGNLVATTFSTTFGDVALTPGADQTYVVRARDTVGNVDGNTQHVTVTATVLDLSLFETEFEPNDAGWSVTAPNDAEAGNWEYGNPSGTPYQSEDDATPDGVNAWITGLAPNPGNGDVDNGTTTLISAQYDIQTSINPVVRFAQWFTNDKGGSPGDPTDTFKIEISNDDGGSWTLISEVGAGTPLAWVPVEIALPTTTVPPTDQMRFRFTAADLGAGSLVEAGIDDFALSDPGQGCNSCPTPANVCNITVNRSGDDVVIDWLGLPGRTVVVYKVNGCDDAIRLGSTTATSFTHENAILSPESFNYRLTVVDDCGVELPFCSAGDITCP